MNPDPSYWPATQGTGFWQDIFQSISVATGLATAAIAAIVATIAYRQYLVERLRLQHDLFERRFEIYKAVQKALSSILHHNKPVDDDYASLADAWQRARFLFGDDVPARLDQYRACANRLMHLHEVIYGDTNSPERPKLVNEQYERLGWVGDQIAELHKLFYPYLRFPLKRPYWWWPRLLRKEK